MTLTERQVQFTLALGRLIVYADAKGSPFKIQELNRDIETQKRNVAAGKSQTINSRHLDKLAVDIVIVKDGKPVFDAPAYLPLGVYWESLGGRWGGRWTTLADPVHFEFTAP